MAGLAWQRRGHVVCGLAQRQGTVVATRARSGYAGVVHDGRATEADRALVTISARGGGDDVVGGLSNGEGTIVAACARAYRLAVVDETHLPPRRREMATFADVGRLRVTLRLAGGGRAVVARETLPRSSFEASADMTRCAIDTRMRTGKRKSRQEMIER